MRGDAGVASHFFASVAGTALGSVPTVALSSAQAGRSSIAARSMATAQLLLLDMLSRLYASEIPECKTLQRFVCPLSRPNTLPGPSHLPIDTPQRAHPLRSAVPIEA